MRSQAANYDDDRNASWSYRSDVASTKGEAGRESKGEAVGHGESEGPDLKEAAQDALLDSLDFGTSVRILSDAMKQKVLAGQEQGQANRQEHASPQHASGSAQGDLPALQSADLLAALKAARESAGMSPENKQVIGRFIQDMQASQQYQRNGQAQQGDNVSGRGLLNLSA
jgi:hypothetical protein